MKNLIRPFWNPSAWVLIIVGALLFSARVRFSPDGWVNLPELATLLELTGGLLILMGFLVFSSMLFWPATNVSKLLAITDSNPIAAAIVLAGLKVFNGLAIIGFAIWLGLTMNGAGH